MFSQARIKITMWYTLIIMAISCSFSLVIYKLQSLEVERFARAQKFLIERRLRDMAFPFVPMVVFDNDLIGESKHRIAMALVLVNSGILVLAGGLAYVLAGSTLLPIKAMVEEQNRFISDASHELRTPLTALKTAFEVNLRDKNLQLNEARNLLGESIKDVDRLKILSDGLLQLAQYQKPIDKQKFDKIQLKGIVGETISLINPLAKQKQIEIRVELTDASFSASRFGIKDLLTILLDNAIKYSPPKSIINVVGEKQNGWVWVSVEDFGQGISKKDMPYIFDRFYRADGARSNESLGGFGLGLAIAKRIVDIHRGTIGVTSLPGEGTKFVVKIPIA